MDEALNAARIGQKIQDSQAPLIEYLVAMAIKGIGLETVQKYCFVKVKQYRIESIQSRIRSIL